MRNVIPFRGVGIPKIRELFSEFYTKEKINEWNDREQFEFAIEFIAGKYSEDKLTGILFIQNYLIEKLDCESALLEFEKVFKNNLIYDWNVCDWFCVRVLGPMIELHGKNAAKHIGGWHKSQNLWQARCSVVAFVYLKDKEIYLKLIQTSCETLIRREERFAKTAVGWILREISKSDEKFVRKFIKKYDDYFSTESRKNALKYLA